MLVLGIETSCDETAAAILRGGKEIVSNVVSSQISIHRPYGGVVPELASRHHLKNIVPVIHEALEVAHVDLGMLDGLAVTRGPGLVGALLVGVQVAKAMAYVTGLPLIGVNHLEGHLCASRLVFNGDGKSESSCNNNIPDRHLALLVSGGHTGLVMVERFGEYRILGATRDDAAGEAFDKVAKLLGLGYPGGPIVETLAKTGDETRYNFPRPLPRKDDLDFSFSGLKTAVVNTVRKEGVLDHEMIQDLCASFQKAVIDVLIKKTFRAARKEQARSVVAAGGVIANGAIRDALIKRAKEEGISLFIPPPQFCTDNAAMIAVAGSIRLMAGDRSGLDLSVKARLPL